MWCNFKYYYSFRYPKASFVLQFFHIYVSFRMLFPWATVSHFFKKSKGCGCPKHNGISVKTYATVSTRNFLIPALLTTVHSFLYVHIRFRTFRIAIRLNWNNYYNITNITPEYYIIPESNKMDFQLTLLQKLVHPTASGLKLNAEFCKVPHWDPYYSIYL